MTDPPTDALIVEIDAFLADCPCGELVGETQRYLCVSRANDFAEMKLSSVGPYILFSDYERLAAQLAEAQEQARQNAEDAERLSWLDRDDIELDCSLRMDKPIVLIFHRKSGALLGEGPDIRAAIDAARAAEQGEKK